MPGQGPQPGAGASLGGLPGQDGSSGTKPQGGASGGLPGASAAPPSKKEAFENLFAGASPGAGSAAGKALMQGAGLAPKKPKAKPSEEGEGASTSDTWERTIHASLKRAGAEDLLRKALSAFDDL